jgi:tetratricopeptide (TPR) repeat protein
VLIGLLHLDRSDTRAASNAVERAAELVATLDLNDSAISAQLVLRAQVLRGRGKLAEARELLTTAAQADLPTLLFPRRQALAHLAGVALQMGDVPAARQTIMRALSVPAEDVRSQVVTQRVLADVLAADGDVEGSRAAAADALRLVEESGFAGELPATRKLVARIGLPGG